MSARTLSIITLAMTAAAPAFAEVALPVAVVSRLHMPVLHFPIALLVVALVIELVQRRRGDGHRAAVGAVLAIAAAAAVVAAVSGIALEQVEAAEGDLVERHELLGIGTAVIAVLSAIAYRRPEGPLRKASLPLMIVAALGVVVAGHLGGKLVHGADYYSEAFAAPADKNHDVVAPTPVAPVAGKDDDTAAGDDRGRHPEGVVPEKPDYVTDIKPLFQRSCVKCHGAEKRKGGLRLDEKRFAMKGGESGVVIVAGDPAKSLVYSMSALPAGDEDVMPSKGKLLALSEIELLKRWIEQGAVWPDDVVTP